ncbi:hypothetical protein DEO72_LG11g1001 [Vigna unguiculata]|uniref:Uncharacterized protein n=1 Tax=Vigna unguiculata TaxID=3917 RepID=A0A4D6NJQ0_VIGUN|nr:hypothetical protein DEO72_LG11g1001 [Vigna unguiculata]
MDKVWVGRNLMTLIVGAHGGASSNGCNSTDPPDQDVIPRRPRGGASCKDVILRRPHGDASLLGRNSTSLVVVPHYTYPDSRVLES